jgi:hypothetical protein
LLGAAHLGVDQKLDPRLRGNGNVGRKRGIAHARPDTENERKPDETRQQTRSHVR